MTRIIRHPRVQAVVTHRHFKKVVNKKTLVWYAIFKAVTYLVAGGFIAFNALNAQAAHDLDPQIRQAKVAYSSQLYYLDHKTGQKKPYISEKVFTSYGNDWSDVKTISPNQLKLWPTANLIKQAGHPTIYYIKGRQKAAIKGPSDLRRFSFDTKNAITVSQAELDSYKTVSYDQIGLTLGAGGDVKKNAAPAPATKQSSTIVSMDAISDGAVAAGQNRNILGTFTITNTSGNTLKLGRLTLKSSNLAFKTSNGYANLSLLQSGTKNAYSTLYLPTSDTPSISFLGATLEPNESMTVDLAVDAKKTALVKATTLSLAKLAVTDTVTGETITAVSEQAPLIKVSAESSENYADETRGQDFQATTPGLLAWPTVSHQINYYFHDANYPYRDIAEHNALDIGTYQGSDVRSAEAGKVVALADNGNTDYNYVTILHDNGLKTSYGHLSKVYVKYGQQVSRGERIALSGGKPGTTGAGQYSTGAHLHFEVIADGDYADPLQFLK